jgi:hypothetical protein
MAITLTPRSLIACARPGCRTVTNLAASVFDSRYGQVCTGCYPTPQPDLAETPEIPAEYRELDELPF